MYISDEARMSKNVVLQKNGPSSARHTLRGSSIWMGMKRNDGLRASGGHLFFKLFMAGGTVYTVKYAEKQGKTVRNIEENQ